MAATLHAELLADNKTIALVGQGDDWELSEMAAAMHHVTPVLKNTKPKSAALLMPLSWAGVVQMAWTFDGVGEHGWWAPGPRLQAWNIAEVARRTAAGQLAPMMWTSTDGRTPRDYQLDGARQIASIGKFLLFDEAGTGKTTTAILGLAWRLALGTGIFPVTVIAPSWDVVTNWEREIARWMPAWRTARWKGTGRAELAGTADVYLTTFATARLDAEDMRGPLVKLKPRAVIIDEIHFCKTPSAKQSLAARRIADRADTVVGLTGTIITRNTKDAWAALAAVDPDSWSSSERYVKRYCAVTETNYQQKIHGLNRAMEAEFRVALLGQTRRVAKEDVLDSLPPKSYSVREVELPEEWRTAYDGMEQDMRAELPDGGVLPVMDQLVKIGLLTRMASAAFKVEVTEELLDNGQIKKHYKAILTAPSWKADALMVILAERPGQQVLAFAESLQLIRVAGQQAEDAGYRIGYVTGLGQGVTEKTRTKAIDDFQAGNLDLICATTGAGGTGITLTRAGTVVYLQRPVKFDHASQSEDRAHRLGSEEFHPHGVEIIDIVAADTADQRTRTLLREKGGQLSEFVGDVRIVRQLLGGIK